MNLSCQIPQDTLHYQIEVGSGLLWSQTLVQFLKKLAHKFAIISDSKVAEKYGQSLRDFWHKEGLDVHLFVFSSGEQSKTRETKIALENQMFEKGFARDSCLIALGGGVATDVGGFIAATYCRGIPLVMIPTSLLGMVDASIGGKTGIDVPYGKNMIGSIYQPKKVVIDIETLQTLPLKELRNGIVEMIKHGIIADPSYFQYLETHVADLLHLKTPIVTQAIYESCRIKKEIVEEDEKESGKRHLLNFGHTVGHALETLTHYSIAHGEAVAIGMLVESHLALQSGYLKKEAFDKIKKILIDYGLPLTLPSNLAIEAILETMTLDKKSRKGQPRYVMIDKIGSALPFEGHYCTEVDQNMIKQALQWMYHDLCRH